MIILVLNNCNDSEQIMNSISITSQTDIILFKNFFPSYLKTLGIKMDENYDYRGL